MSAISSVSRSFVTSATSSGSIYDKIVSLTSSDKFFKISPSFLSSISCHIKALLFGGLDSIISAISYAGKELNNSLDSLYLPLLRIF